MTKTLFIIRHAKSDWSNDCADHERGLNDRGCSDAELIAAKLLENQFFPEAVFCSTARRAKLTLQGLNKHVGLSSNAITYDEALYLASLNELLKYIESIDNSYSNIALVGHNPGLTELCNYLVGDNLSNLPTCGVYSISFSVDDWRAVGEGLGSRCYFITPKMFKA